MIDESLASIMTDSAAGATHRQAESAEQTLWSGHPSQLTNSFRYLAAVIGLAVLYVFFPRRPYLLAIPMLYAYWQWLSIQLRRYELTTQRLITRTGLLNNLKAVELYRVKDYSMPRSIFGIGTILVVSNDVDLPLLRLQAIYHPRRVLDLIRDRVECERDRKGVRVVDYKAS